MAGWDDLVAYVRMRYEIMRQADDELWFNLPTRDERTQLVVVRLSTAEDGHPWAQITSPVGRTADLDLPRMLTMAGESIVGGAIAADGVVLFRHSVPLDDAVPTDPAGSAGQPSPLLAGFERSFRLVVEVADRLEHALTGADEH